MPHTPEQMIEVVRRAATEVGISAGDDFSTIDSLQLFDLVVELERVLGVTIPTAGVTLERFASPAIAASYLLSLAG